MMQKDTSQLINDYIDKALDDEQLRQFEELLNKEPQLARQVSILCRQRELCLSDKVSLKQNLSENIKRKLQYNRNSQKIFRYKVAAAFIGILFISSAIWLISNQGNTKTESSPMIAMETAPSEKSPAMLMLKAATKEAAEQRLQNYHLKIYSENIKSSERIIGQLAYEHGISDTTKVSRTAEKSVFVIQTDNKSLTKLSNELRAVWQTANSINLTFTDYPNQISSEIDNINPSQLVQIIAAADLDTKVRIAKAAKAINSLPSLPYYDNQTDFTEKKLSMMPVLAARKNNSKSGFTTLTIEILADN